MAKNLKLDKEKQKEEKKEIEKQAKKELPLDEYLKKIGVIDGTVLETRQSRRHTYSTGIWGLDLALNTRDFETGKPGLAARSITELIGPNQSLKTAVAEYVTLDIQNRNPSNIVIWICPEEASMSRMASLGIDRKRVIPLHIYHPDLSEQYCKAEFALKQAIKVCRDRPEVKGVIIDTVKALCTGLNDPDDKEIPLTKEQVAIRAKLWNAFIRHFRALNHSDALLLALNQISETNINADGGRPSFRPGMPSSASPNSYDTQMMSAGGFGIQHDADYRIYALGKAWWAKKSPTELVIHPVFQRPIEIGIEVHHRVFKNKDGPDEGNRCSVAFFNRKKKQFDTARQVLVQAESIDLVETGGGGWFYFNKEKTEKAQGLDKAVSYLRDNPEVMDRLMVELAKPENLEKFFELGMIKSETELK